MVDSFLLFGHRPRGGLGAMSGDAVIGAVLAGGLLIAVFALTASKKRGTLSGRRHRSRR